MLKYVDTKICFQEVPNEVSLCISLSGCPHRCEDCHSSYLQEDVGDVLTVPMLDKLIESNDGITCICFMGGDNDIPTLHGLAKYVQEKYNLRTAWYTGLMFRPTMDRPIAEVFDYIKVGPYIKECGPLVSKTTNQRMYAKGSVLQKMDMSPNMFYDITDKFWTDNDN